jgi:hypothetical protein
MLFEVGDNADITFDVVAPKFIKIRNKSTEIRRFGSETDYVAGSVEIAFDTSAPGEFEGEVIATLGRTTAKVPVSVAVKTPRPGLTRILVPQTPFTKYSTQDGKMFEAWTQLVKDGSLDVSYLLVDRGKPVLRDLDLAKFDCVFLATEALVDATAEDVKRIRDFAEKGGRVVLAANSFFRGSVEKANAVLADFGLEMRDEEAGPPAKEDIAIGKDAPELVKAKVESVRFFRGSPIAVTDPAKARVLVPAVGVGLPGDGFVVSAKAGKGKVTAIGQSLWSWWISDEYGDRSDNAQLLQWLLTSSTR